ncbi:unnamed protein product [Alopecurus aequalis]
MAGYDRLSNLPDDLLRRVLHFAPVREAASTSALSTRWRGLSRSSGAVNLETRVAKGTDRKMCMYYVEADDPYLSQRKVFISAAKAALVASEAAVTRLTFRVEGVDSEDSIYFYSFLYHGSKSERVDVLADLLSHPAARQVEELRLATGEFDDCPLDQEVRWLRTGLYDLSFLSLPSKTLRVLEIAGCKGFKTPVGVFPLLASLRLSFCKILLEHLQSLIDATPALATLHLQSVKLKGDHGPGETGKQSSLRLRCPSVTALLLEKCNWKEEEANAYAHSTTNTAVDINAPRLRRFTYKGLLRQITLRSQVPNMARVELHIFDEYRPAGDENLRRAIFWRVLHNFSHAMELKLRVNHLEDIAIVGASERTDLLRPFGNLGRLELEGLHRPKGKTAAVAIANLLRCCPVVRDLRISLTTAQGGSSRESRYGTCFLERKYRHDLDKSIHNYKRRRLEPMVSVKGDDEDAHDDAAFDQVPDLPALSGRLFNCLQASLKCLRLQFRKEKTNCFGLKLIKFFAENAVVLEEMRIDSGNGKLCEHIEVERWVAHSSKKRKTNLRVLPLERQN